MSGAELLRWAARELREPLGIAGLQALPVGSAVVTSGGIVWTKYGDQTHDAEYEWGRCNRIGGKFRDSAWLAKTDPRLIYVFDDRSVHAGADALADWLDLWADLGDKYEFPEDTEHLIRPALGVARAYLGEADDHT